MKILSFLILALTSASCFGGTGKASSFISKYCTNKSIAKVIEQIIVHESKSVFDGKIQAWAWTLNVNGKGYYYQTKEEAEFAVNIFTQYPDNVVDIGLGQVNFKYHGMRVNGKATRLLEPSENIRVMCEILSEGMSNKRVKNITDLVAFYHRPVLDEKAYRYAKKVLSSNHM